MRFTLLNTRPAQQAASLNQLVVAAGGEFLHCPTLAIVPTDMAVTQTKIALANRQVDKVIFISANAVEQYAQQKLSAALQGLMNHAEFYAIGRATALMGEKHNLPIKTLSDTQFDSENLLAHDVMQKVNGQTILLVKGVGGREILQDTLTERGAKVLPLALYERRPTPFCNAAWNQFMQRNNGVLLITSIASWDAFYHGYSQWQAASSQSMNSVITVVMSQRIAEHIANFAWSCRIIVVSTQSNAGIIKAIEEGLS